MAEIINQFTQQQNVALEEQKAQYQKYIKRLKRDLADGSSVVARQTTQISAQQKEIQSLQVSKKRMASQISDMEAKLRAAEDRDRRLAEKYHVCKNHLNSAIQEQQDLYTRSKKQWGETIEQMRAMEKSRIAEAEMAVQKAEVIREQMMEKVRQAVTSNKGMMFEGKYYLPLGMFKITNPLFSIWEDRRLDTAIRGKKR